MSGIVSTFLDTQLGKGKYLFFLIMWLDFESDITKALNDNWEKFGEAIGTDRLAIRPFSKSNDKTYDEVQKKEWLAEIAARMSKEQDPYMLIINTAFEEFDPKEHVWSIVWFSDFQKSPEVIYRLFGAFARKIHGGEDIFDGLTYCLKRQNIQDCLSILR